MSIEIEVSPEEFKKHQREMTKVAEAEYHARRAESSTFEHTGPEIGCLLIDFAELHTWGLWRGAIAEFFGMVLFLFFTVGTVAATAGYSADNGFEGLDSGRHWMIASVFGFMIACLVFAIAPASGGNLNPAVSVALACTQKITPVRCVVYIASQCAGSAVGCLLVKAVSQKAYDLVGGAVNAVNRDAGFTVGGAFIGEVMGTMLLVFIVQSLVDSNNGHPERVNMKQSNGVGSVGICVTMAHCVLIPITNCSINPARSFGASLVAGEFPDHWLFWVAPILGGLISAFAYEVVFKDRPELT